MMTCSLFSEKIRQQELKDLVDMADEIQREKENEINNVYSIMEPGLKNFDDSFSTL